MSIAESRRECHLCGDLTIRLKRKSHLPMCRKCQEAEKKSLFGIRPGAVGNAIAIESRSFLKGLRDRIFKRDISKLNNKRFGNG